MKPQQAPPPPPPSTTTTTTTTTNNNKIILGKYQLGRLLGRGSFAKVYHAQSLTTTTNKINSVAIKVIEKPKSPELSATMEPRILHEISAMHRLKTHPNILKIHEVMATKSRIYLVMDLAVNGDLSTRISHRGRFIEPTARRYFHQLISALHFCHQNGVAHRDIKPQNLLLDHNGTLKISDFGLSALPDLHSTSSDLLLRTACGTPAYAAPEVFRRGGVEGYDGAKADAWSCGVILFLFLAGYLPFDDSNLSAMYKKICRREFQFPNWVSGRARFIISQLLDPNPSTRMSIESLVGHVWFRKSKSLPAHFIAGPIVECDKFGKLTGMNAFDIISMSSGLDLSGLFKKTSCGDRERRFTAKGSVEVVEERVEEVGGRLGYTVERELMKGGRGLGLLLKGRVVLVFEILVVAMELVMVVVKVVDGVEFDQGVHWEELRVGFEDLALSWDNNGN